MPREYTIRSWCDLCAGVGERCEATHVDVPITIANARPATLDLCELHYKELLLPVLDALAEYGADPPSTRPQPSAFRPRNRNPGRAAGPFKCLVEGCIATPLKHRGTLWQHLRGVHETTLDAYEEKYGELVPLTREEQAEVVIEVSCEVAGCNQAYSTALGNRWPQQAMISHMWGHHSIKWKPAS